MQRLGRIAAFGFILAGIFACAPAHADNVPNGSAIASGDGFTCSVTGTGRVRCWGGNTFGQLGDGTTTQRLQPTLVSGVQGAVAVSAGTYHACALLGDMTVKCWGYNNTGQLGIGRFQQFVPIAEPVVGLTTAVRIAAGNDHTCAMLQDATAVCWGSNGSGQLGNGGGGNTNAPVFVAGLANAANVVSGGNHSCALMVNNGVKCWGANAFGQLGTGNTALSTTPVDVVGVGTATAIALGDVHSCAIVMGNAVRCWGANYVGQLGNGSSVGSSTPVPVVGINDASAIAAGGSETCVARPNQPSRCWGAYQLGQLGNGSVASTLVPTDVPGVFNASLVDVGRTHACGRIVNQLLFCWGDNREGQLGNGQRGQAEAPMPAFTFFDSASVAAGIYFTCARTNTGEVRCAGYNSNGQLGNGDLSVAYRELAQPVVGVGGATALAASETHACAIVSLGAVKCWGRNVYGALGNGAQSDSATAVTVANVSNAIAIATSQISSCAVISGGTVKCWGGNFQGELGDAGASGSFSLAARDVPGITDAASITAGSLFFCVRRTGGGVKCWGRNQEGQLGNGNPGAISAPVEVQVAGVTALDVGFQHACAATDIGQVYCWGSNDNGQLGFPGGFVVATPQLVPNVFGATLVAAGGAHTCVGGVGPLFCWGRNFNGQLGNGTTNGGILATPVNGIPGNITAITAGSSHTCAVVDGMMTFCWGLKYYGAFGDGERGFEPMSVPVSGSPFTAFTLAYAAGANGTVTGTLEQFVDRGDSGSDVTAVPAPGYRFVRWSDDGTANPRRDSNVQANVNVTAIFANGAPGILAMSVSPGIVHEHEPATIAVLASDLEPGPLSFSFDCDNDGTFEVGPQASNSATCAIGAPRQYTVRVRVQDAPGLSASDAVVFDAIDSAPVATLGTAATVLEDTPIALNATATSPSTGETIASVEVDCDYDGTTFTTDVSAASAAALGDCPGVPVGTTRTLAIRATDNEPQTGAIATKSVVIVPVNDAPTFFVPNLVETPAGATGALTVPFFATFDAGPDDEDLTQAVASYEVVSIVDANQVLVANSLGVATNGFLTFSLRGVGGQATITLRVRDNGGTANGGQDTSEPQSFVLSVPRSADLQVAITNNRSNLVDGEDSIYAIVVANAGPDTADGAHVSNTLPASLVDAQWVCVQALSNTACPTPASGSGALTTDVSLAPGGFLRFDLVAEVDGNVGAFVTNEVAVSAPSGVTGLDATNDTASDSDAIVTEGIFRDGFENSASALTVSGAQAALDAAPGG